MEQLESVAHKYYITTAYAQHLYIGYKSHAEMFHINDSIMTMQWLIAFTPPGFLSTFIIS